jgi:hypothetical protein
MKTFIHGPTNKKHEQVLFCVAEEYASTSTISLAPAALSAILNFSSKAVQKRPQLSLPLERAEEEYFNPTLTLSPPSLLFFFPPSTTTL